MGLKLQSLEVHLFDPDTKGRGKRDRDTKEMIMKIKDCLMAITECGYLALFVNASKHFDERIVGEFVMSGFKKESSELWFVKKKGPRNERIQSHLEQYWEPHGIDPYA